jgi:hypothetical protein
VKRAVPFQSSFARGPARFDQLLSALLVLLVGACVGLGNIGRARADDLADFEAARSLYEGQSYARAVDAFRLLVGSDAPRLTDPLLVLESRKYLAASLLFMGAEAEARTQFRLLLRQEPKYALDPLAFPTDVYAQFEQVKRELRDELEAQKKAEEAARRAAEELKQRLQEERTRNLQRLRLLASTEELHDKNSRWIATVPFGVGQFQNGDKGLGVALAMSESLAAATSVVSYVVHQRLSDATPGPSSLDEARRVESTWRTANIVSFSVFAALALIGIIDAHVRFVPERVTRRARPLPPDLERWMRDQNLSRGAPVLRF